MAAKKSAKKAPAKKAAKAAKPAGEKKPKAKKEPKAKKPSALDAAAKVFGEAGAPLNCQEMIKAMADKGYWSRDVLAQRWLLKDETYERANPKRILRCGSGQCLRSGGTRAILAYQKEERPPRQMASKHRPGTGCGGAHLTLWVTCAAEASTVTGCEVS